MPTSTDPIYIRDLAAVPAGSRLRLYGAGGRGDEVLASLRLSRPDVTVLEFLDTFKSGERQGLPVRTLDRYAAERTDDDDGLILIVSAFYPSILESLAGAGIVAGVHVLLKDVDPPFVACLPEERVVAALAGGTHPLRRPPRDTRPDDGRCWRCADFSSVYFRPTGLSFCCWLPDLARIGNDPAGAVARLTGLRGHFEQATDANRHPYCAACPSLQPATTATATPRPGRIQTLHLDISTVCNLECTYCIVKNSMQSLDYDFPAVLSHILEEGLLADDFRFSWGGLGEPTLNPHFDAVTEELIARGGTGLVYSNCVKYSKSIEKNLAARLQVVCSFDAGRPATYAALRGRDRFAQVCDNVTRYIAAAGPQLFTAKYILLAENCDAGELADFVAACTRAGVQHVLIAKDFYSQETEEAIVRGMGTLYRLCREAGLAPAFLDTAVSPEQKRRALAFADNQTVLPSA